MPIKSIFEVANFLSIILFSEEHMALAIENPTFFNFWDKPLIENGEFDLIKTHSKIIGKKPKPGGLMELKISGEQLRLNRI